MKGKRYADVDAIQKASTAILNAIPKDDLKKSFANLLDRANRCIQCEGNHFEGDQGVCKTKTIFCFFYKVLELANSTLYFCLNFFLFRTFKINSFYILLYMIIIIPSSERVY